VANNAVLRVWREPVANDKLPAHDWTLVCRHLMLLTWIASITFPIPPYVAIKQQGFRVNPRALTPDRDSACQALGLFGRIEPTSRKPEKVYSWQGALFLPNFIDRGETR
jgi:hypothetical protein